MLRSAGIAIAAVLIAGATYEQIGRWQDRTRCPQIGRSVDIGGRVLNIYCSGSGGPAVVFETGRGNPGYSWVHVQRETSRFAQACWYDRAGYGWSDSATYPRTALEMAKDLHALLQAAGVPPAYVLVGHSMGGYNARVYNSLFPDEVGGIVLVDSAHLGEGSRIPPHRGGWLSAYWRRSEAMLAQFLNGVGIVRLRSHLETESGPPPRDISAREWSTISALSRQPKSITATEIECQGVCGEQARAAGGFGDRPLIVLTAGKPMHVPSDPVRAREAYEGHRAWIKSQAQLAELSSRGRQEIVEDSDHGIPFESPGAVIDAVREVVAAVRAARP